MPRKRRAKNVSFPASIGRNGIGGLGNPAPAPRDSSREIGIDVTGKG
jgi:hypothetical protein